MLLLLILLLSHSIMYDNNMSKPPTAKTRKSEYQNQNKLFSTACGNCRINISMTKSRPCILAREEIYTKHTRSMYKVYAERKSPPVPNSHKLYIVYNRNLPTQSIDHHSLHLACVFAFFLASLRNNNT